TRSVTFLLPPGPALIVVCPRPGEGSGFRAAEHPDDRQQSARDHHPASPSRVPVRRLLSWSENAFIKGVLAGISCEAAGIRIPTVQQTVVSGLGRAHMTTGVRRVLVLVVLMLAAAGVATAQVQNGIISVKTVDEQGAVIPGATITISSA